MRIRQARSMAASLFAALVAMSAWPPSASAAPQELTCMLANSGSNQSQSHPITVTFDENAKTLQAQDGNQNYQFQNVSISNIAISGDVDTISIGIDRSSLGLVWQQYGSDKPVIAYGQCRPSSASAGGH